MTNSMSKTGSGYTKTINNYAYCNYVSMPFGDGTNQQSLANCGYLTSDGISETVQTYVSSATYVKDSYSHWNTSSTTGFLQGSSSAVDNVWMADEEVDFTVSMNEGNTYIMWSGCAMRPFEDDTLALVAGEKVNVKGSSYIWRSNSSNSSSSKYYGAQGSAVEVTILDAASGASTLVTAAAVATVAALSF